MTLFPTPSGTTNIIKLISVLGKGLQLKHSESRGRRILNSRAVGLYSMTLLEENNRFSLAYYCFSFSNYPEPEILNSLERKQTDSQSSRQRVGN